MTIDLTCPYCSFSKKVPEEKIPAGARWATCPRCGQRFKIRSSDRDGGLIISKAPSDADFQYADREAEKEPSRRTTAPWENRSELGLWKAIYQTIKEVLFSPDRFFSTLIYKDGLKEPLAFGILTGSVGSMFSVFWQFLMLSGGLLSIIDTLTGQFAFGIIFIISIVFIPLFVIIGMFISSAILHLFLMLLRGADHGFEATFRVVSYSQAVQMWGLIPFIGGWVSLIWQLIVQIIGLREIHETSYLKVIFSFLIPVAIVVFLLLTAIILFVFLLGYLNFDKIWS